MCKLIALFMLVLLALPSLAVAEGGPCERGSVHMQIAGADLNVLRCQLIVMGQQAGTQAMQLADAIAELRLAQKDLADAQARVKEWSEFFKNYTGEK